MKSWTKKENVEEDKRFNKVKIAKNKIRCWWRGTTKAL